MIASTDEMRWPLQSYPNYRMVIGDLTETKAEAELEKGIARCAYRQLQGFETVSIDRISDG